MFLIYTVCMWLSLYLWACCNGVGCYLARTRKYFGTVSQNAGYFSVSLEYIFVVNWLRSVIFFFDLSLHTTVFLCIIITCFFFPRTDVSVFIFSWRWAHVFHFTRLCCTAKKSLTLGECCFRVSVCPAETWEKAKHFDSQPIILACLIIL